MNIKEIALRLAKSMRDKSGYTTLDLVCNAEAFAEALVAELAKENKPVARMLVVGGMIRLEGFIGASSQDSSMWEPLYTLPPTAEQAEQETAEAIARMCDLIYGNGSAASQAARDGSWRTCK